jgi:ribosomal protein S18 acetylase RimI-like enzyme
MKLLRAIRETDRFRVITLGILPEFRGRGLDSQLIMTHVLETGRTSYADAELSWVLEDNVGMVKPIVAMGGEESIRLRLYEQAL